MTGILAIFIGIMIHRVIPDQAVLIEHVRQLTWKKGTVASRHAVRSHHVVGFAELLTDIHFIEVLW